MGCISQVYIFISIGDIDVGLNIFSRIFQHVINQFGVLDDLLHCEDFVNGLSCLRIVLNCDGINAVRLAISWYIEVKNILLDVGCVEDF